MSINVGNNVIGGNELSNADEASEYSAQACGEHAGIPVSGMDFNTGEIYYGCISIEGCYEFLLTKCEENKSLKKAVYDCGSLDCNNHSNFVFGNNKIEKTLYSRLLELPFIGGKLGDIFNKVDCSKGMIATYLSPTKVYCEHPDDVSII